MSVGCEARYITTAYCLRLLWDRIYEGWSKSASDQGVTVTEEQALRAIWLMGCGTVTEVARRLRRDKGTISKCVYSLEESGLIIRKAGPARRSYVFELSPEGDRVRLGLAKAHGRHSVVYRALATLDEEEQEALLRIILKVLADVEGETYMENVVRALSAIGRVSRE